MLNLIVNGARVSYDSLDEAKDAARESGLAFWRETLTECAGNEAMWNEFLNDLWQSGAEDEAERLDRIFPKDAPRHWLLVAVTLDGDDPWQSLLVEWNAQGDRRILSAVSSAAFMPWLKQMKPKKHDLLTRAFGVDAEKWPNDLLLKALKSEDAEAEVAEWQAVVEKRKEPKPGDEMTITLPGGVPMIFCWCPATTSNAWKAISGGDDFFWMGSPEIESNQGGRQTQHRVKLTMGFWMGKYPVTQRQWKTVMGANPSGFKGDDRPVENVSWEDCQAFVLKSNASLFTAVALPTEAQGEYACRAGTTTPFSFGLSLSRDNANYGGRYPYGMSGGRYQAETSSVGKYTPNAWGLHDMHGNVFEWCADWFGDYNGDVTDPIGPALGVGRVCRGGCWFFSADDCCSAARYYGASGSICEACDGFRLVCRVGCCC